jgi:hypothetical protein
MDDKSPEARKTRRLRNWGHPLLWVIPGLCWLILAGLNTWAYLFMVSDFGVGALPGVNPMVAVGVGLAGGACVVLFDTWRTRKYLEEEARRIAFGERHWKPIVLPMLFFPTALGATLGLYFIIAGKGGFVLAILAQAAFFAPWVFLHRPHSRIYQRAQVLLAQPAVMPGASVTPDAFRLRRIRAWADALGVTCVVGLLALGVWLQWGLPWMAEREPRHYETKDAVPGIATRLTYGGDAIGVSLSPNGRFIAFRKSVGFGDGRLETMRPDGSGKRLLGEAQHLSPAGFRPVRWSPDGRRILVIGDRVPAPKTWDEAFKQGKPFAYDLWTVDVASGAARRLTDDDAYRAGMWLPAVHKIAAIRCTRHKWARLWLMDERGGNRFKVAALKLRSHSLAAQPWHGGRDIVAVGMDDTAGIWSVDTTTGKATRLSDIEAGWALPIAPQWLVIGVEGRPDPPFHRATSIGLFDTGTGKVHWALRDLQGTVEHPCLVPKLGVVVFTLWLDEGHDLWALRISDGGLRRLTHGESATNAAVDRNGKTIFYQASNEERERFRGLNIGESIWRLDVGRPLSSARWEVWP